MAIGDEVIVKIEADIKDLKTKLSVMEKEITKSFSSIENKSHSLSDTVRTLMKVAFGGVAIAMIKRFTTSFLNAMKEQELAIQQVSNLAQIQGYNFNQVRMEIEKLTSAMQRKTMYGDEEMQKAMARALATGAEYTQVMKNLSLIMDVAAGTGMDLGTAAMYVARAMMGQPEMLARYVPAIRNLAQEERDWANVKEILIRQFDGMAERMGETLPGQMKRLQNFIGDLKEELGYLIGEIVEAMLPYLEEGVHKLIDMTRRLVDSIRILKTYGDIMGRLRISERISEKVKELAARWRMLNEQLKSGKGDMEAIRAEMERISRVIHALGGSLRTSYETMGTTMREVSDNVNLLSNELSDVEYKLRTGRVSGYMFSAVMKETGKTVEETGREVKESTDLLTGEIENLFDRVLNGIIDMMSGVKVKWDELIKGFLIDILRIYARQFIITAFTGGAGFGFSPVVGMAGKGISTAIGGTPLEVVVKADGLVSLKDPDVQDTLYTIAIRPAQDRYEQRLLSS